MVIALRILPVNFFVTHDLPLCWFKRVLKIDCPGCGTLRALSQLAHGNWRAAWAWNQLIFFEIGALIILHGYWWKKGCYKN